MNEKVAISKFQTCCEICFENIIDQKFDISKCQPTFFLETLGGLVFYLDFA